METAWFILLGVVVAAQTVETTLGFGATVIALSVGAHFVPLRELVVALVLLSFVQSSWIVLRGRRRIEWRIVLTRIFPWVAVGFPVGIGLGTIWSETMLKMILGGLVVAISLKELVLVLMKRRSERPLPEALGAATLAGGGFFHGLFATGGPLIVLYVGKRIPEKSSFRATLAVLWLALNSILVGIFFVQGRVEAASLLHAGFLLPALAGGILLGEILHAVAPARLFHAMVHVLLLAIGVTLFV